jgi:hypothetical protein
LKKLERLRSFFKFCARTLACCIDTRVDVRQTPGRVSARHAKVCATGHSLPVAARLHSSKGPHLCRAPLPAVVTTSRYAAATGPILSRHPTGARVDLFLRHDIDFGERCARLCDGRIGDRLEDASRVAAQERKRGERMQISSARHD